MDSPAGGARGGRGGGRGRGAFSRGGVPGSGPPRGPAADRPRGGGGSGAMRGNPRRDPVGTRAPRPTYQPPGRRPGGPHVNEGPTVEVRVEGWRESKGGADECISFLERKTKMTFKKVRLIIQKNFLFFIRLLSLSLLHQFVDILFLLPPSMRWCFFVLLRRLLLFGSMRRVVENWVHGLWTSGDFYRYYQSTSHCVAHRGHTISNTNYPTSKKSSNPKTSKKTSKKRNSCENNLETKWKAEKCQNDHFPSFPNAPSFSYHADS